MKQFVFSLRTDVKAWEEQVLADGMYDALNKIKRKKREFELETHSFVQVKLKGITYHQSA